MTFLSRARTFLEVVKFEHTAFALPFAYLGMILAKKTFPDFGVFFWTTAAMVGARTAGMALNRVIDRNIDAANPRTHKRPTVTGEFQISWAWTAVAVSLGVFFLAAWLLNDLCFKLSFVAIVLLSGYHYVKRFSFLSHFTLGLVLAIAPMGGWIAVTGSFSWVPVPLALAVLFWVAGFDILYSLQDFEFDRANGLHSVPVRFGQKTAVRASGWCHIATVLFLALFGLAAGLGIVYWTGVLVVAGLLRLEHYLVADGDLSRINTAFFTINGWIGILLLIFTFLEILK